MASLLNRNNFRSSIRKNIGGNTRNSQRTSSYDAWEKYEKGSSTSALIDIRDRITIIKNDENHTFEDSLFCHVYDKELIGNQSGHLCVIKGPNTSGIKLKWFCLNIGAVYTGVSNKVSNPLTLIFESISGCLYNWVQNPNDETFQNYLDSLLFGKRVFKDMMDNQSIWEDTISILDRYFSDNNVENSLAYIAGTSLYSIVKAENSSIEGFPDINRNRIYCIALISLSRTFKRFGSNFSDVKVLKCILPIIISLKVSNGENFGNLVNNTIDDFVKNGISDIPKLAEYITTITFSNSDLVEIAKITSVVVDLLTGPKLKYVDKLWNQIITKIGSSVTLNGTVYQFVEKIGMEGIGASYNGEYYCQNNTSNWGLAGLSLADKDSVDIYVTGKTGFDNDSYPGVRIFMGNKLLKPKGKNAITSNGGKSNGYQKPVSLYGSKRIDIKKYNNEILCTVRKDCQKFLIKFNEWSNEFQIPGQGNILNVGFKGCNIRFNERSTDKVSTGEVKVNDTPSESAEELSRKMEIMKLKQQIKKLEAEI